MKAGISGGYGEETTSARLKARCDLRNAVSFAAMNSLVVELAEPPLILNMNSTQYCVGHSAKKKIKVKYFNKPKTIKVAPNAQSSNSITSYFVK